VILKAIAKKITWIDDAEIAGVTDRTMRRIKQRHEQFGYTGLFDQWRGHRRIHRVPLETVEKVLGLYREYTTLVFRDVEKRRVARSGEIRPRPSHIVTRLPYSFDCRQRKILVRE
jgi:hypothetical protein